MEYKYRRHFLKPQTHVVELAPLKVLCASNTTVVTFTVTVHPTWDDQSGVVF